MAVHIFREHNKDADASAEHGANGERQVWEDAGDVVWSGDWDLWGLRWQLSCMWVRGWHVGESVDSCSWLVYHLQEM